MRMRLGLLQDPAIIERQIAREAEKAEKERKARIAATIAANNPDAPPRTSYDVPTKVESEEEAAARKKEEREAEKKVREEEAQRMEKIRIRPLSDAKAIDSGANFVSEAFLFLVAGGLILFETWRSRRKEANRREDVKERIEKLEAREVDFEKREQDFELIIAELRGRLGESPPQSSKQENTGDEKKPNSTTTESDQEASAKKPKSSHEKTPKDRQRQPESASKT